MTMFFQILPRNGGGPANQIWLFLNCSRAKSIQKFSEIMQK